VHVVKCSASGEKMKIMLQVMDILSMRDASSLIWQDGEDQDNAWLQWTMQKLKGKLEARGLWIIKTVKCEYRVWRRLTKMMVKSGQC
jgi:hypothetical protein